MPKDPTKPKKPTKAQKVKANIDIEVEFFVQAAHLRNKITLEKQSALVSTGTRVSERGEWSTEQRLFLDGHAPDLTKRMPDKNYTNFWSPIYAKFHTNWSEQQFLFPELPKDAILTKFQEAALNRGVELRRNQIYNHIRWLARNALASKPRAVLAGSTARHLNRMIKQNSRVSKDWEMFWRLKRPDLEVDLQARLDALGHKPSGAEILAASKAAAEKGLASASAELLQEIAENKAKQKEILTGELPDNDPLFVEMVRSNVRTIVPSLQAILDYISSTTVGGESKGVCFSLVVGCYDPVTGEPSVGNVHVGLDPLGQSFEHISPEWKQMREAYKVFMKTAAPPFKGPIVIPENIGDDVDEGEEDSEGATGECGSAVLSLHEDGLYKMDVAEDPLPGSAVAGGVPDNVGASVVIGAPVNVGAPDSFGGSDSASSDGAGAPENVRAPDSFGGSDGAGSDGAGAPWNVVASDGVGASNAFCGSEITVSPGVFGGSHAVSAPEYASVPDALGAPNAVGAPDSTQSGDLAELAMFNMRNHHQGQANAMNDVDMVYDSTFDTLPNDASDLQNTQGVYDIFGFDTSDIWQWQSSQTTGQENSLGNVGPTSHLASNAIVPDPFQEFSGYASSQYPVSHERGTVCQNDFVPYNTPQNQSLAFNVAAAPASFNISQNTPPVLNSPVGSGVPSTPNSYFHGMTSSTYASSNGPLYGGSSQAGVLPGSSLSGAQYLANTNVSSPTPGALASSSAPLGTLSSPHTLPSTAQATYSPPSPSPPVVPEHRNLDTFVTLLNGVQMRSANLPSAAPSAVSPIASPVAFTPVSSALHVLPSDANTPPSTGQASVANVHLQQQAFSLASVPHPASSPPAADVPTQRLVSSPHPMIQTPGTETQHLPDISNVGLAPSRPQRNRNKEYNPRKADQAIGGPCITADKENIKPDPPCPKKRSRAQKISSG
ncbi:hypothetical protein CONPUDRAFT_151356 [Coniophora puteana RWD-64-598 SS2]|uniref:Uncharacterized protein n=1 Tax=Coniophora puteana (strain RWD-64-598) TaxID=741705 RepID=A0A5M3MYU3_CONPW|nr:uncharacterized protein CONPUDRAFT_151356 [Coniophora puteana RWD-64-598 SS2]EIW84333.1 hypothetical protein CONPUDRAFT_151356 [Coniophora puteana RWD-64-598 SS2]